MSTLWQSDMIEVGGEQVIVQAAGGVVLLTRQTGDNANCWRWTPRAALVAAHAHLAMAEALYNASNRVQQAIDDARLRRERGEA